MSALLRRTDFVGGSTCVRKVPDADLGCEPMLGYPPDRNPLIEDLP
jgi:hypothetical protein